MKIEDKVLLSFYKECAPLDNKSKAVLVKHIETGEFFVKKEISTDNKALYRTLQKSHPPGIPEIFHIIEDANSFTIIEEFISGTSLDSFLSKCGLLELKTAAGFMVQLCDILKNLHAASPAVIHRDIKPSNIIISPGERIFLIDFNAAKQYDINKSEDTVLMGTVNYAAPEQFGFGQSDPKTDIYALGILFNIMLTGKFPKEALYDGAAKKTIVKCTNIDPAKRYESIVKLKKDLLRLLKTCKSGCSYDAKASSSATSSYLPPGFRSRTPWKAALMSLLYFLIAFFGLTLEVENSPGTAATWANRACFILCALFPVFLCSNYRGLASNLPLTKNPNRFVKILGFMLWTFVFLFAVISLLNVFVPLPASPAQ